MEVKNKLSLFTAAFLSIHLFGCSNTKKIPDTPLEIDGLTFMERVELSYAEQFTIDRYEDGYSLICTMNGEKFLVVPDEKKAPEGLAENITVIDQPADNIYLAATSAMGLFSELDAGASVKFSSIKAEDWYIDYARTAMENGDLLYAGKYREPDYELLLSGGCELAVESTMIEHSPEVKEKLEELDIPVFIDYSSYESHPLGRSEWIKVYAEMTGTSELAEELFNKQSAQLEDISNKENTGKTAVYFYISSSGQIVTRKSGDYVTKMIELAGGENVFRNLGDSEKATASVTIEMEKFYSEAKEADHIIYNSTNSSGISSIDDLIAKNELLADFKAVKNGDVWCTRQNLFQETMKLGTVINDFHTIFTDTADIQPPEFLFRLEYKDGEAVE